MTQMTKKDKRMAIIKGGLLPAGRKSVGGVTLVRVRGNQVMKQKIIRNQSNTDAQNDQRNFFRVVQIWVQFWYGFVAQFLPKTLHGSQWNGVLKKTLVAFRSIIFSSAELHTYRELVRDGLFRQLISVITAKIVDSGNMGMVVYPVSNPVQELTFAITNTATSLTFTSTVKVSTSKPADRFRGGFATILTATPGIDAILASAEFTGILSAPASGQVIATFTATAKHQNVAPGDIDQVLTVFAFQVRERNKWVNYQVPLLLGTGGIIAGGISTEFSRVTFDTLRDVDVKETTGHIEHDSVTDPEVIKRNVKATKVSVDKVKATNINDVDVNVAGFTDVDVDVTKLSDSDEFELRQERENNTSGRRRPDNLRRDDNGRYYLDVEGPDEVTIGGETHFRQHCDAFGRLKRK